MELHAHTHTPRKKWTHYFWEFIMLFLAIFCGFLAEYQLEHMIEHQREKQFMKSMVEDLEKDILLLQLESSLAKERYEGLDSLAEIIFEGKLEQSQIRKIYIYQRKYLVPLTLQLIDRTELQLKNSGGMRLIRNKQVTDSLIAYWSFTELIYETKNNINTHRDKAKDLSFTIFNSKYYMPSTESFLEELNGKPELTTSNTAVLSEFASRVSHMSDLMKILYTGRRIPVLMDKATRLVQLIKKEYHMQSL